MNLQGTVLPVPPRAKFSLPRAVVLLVLWVGLSFAADLFLLSCFPLDSGFLQQFLNGKLLAMTTRWIPIFGMIGLNLGAFFYAGWRLKSKGRRVLVYSGLGVVGILAADVVIMACFPQIADPVLERVIERHSSEIALFVGIISLIPLGVLAALWRLRSWRWIAASYFVLGAFLLYLANDDSAVVHPFTVEQVSPVLPGDETSFNVLMRYGKNHPLGRSFKAPDRIFMSGNDRFVDASKPAGWAEWLSRHQAAVEADWADLGPVRAWMEELDGYSAIGDLTPAKLDAEIITFAPLRSYSQHATEIAGLQAIAGHGDEAMATLLPLLRVSRKMEPSSRTLVRTMIARVMQKQAVATANFVLDTTTVSPAMRARLEEALSIGIGGEAGIRHLLVSEAPFVVAESDGSRPEVFFLSGKTNRALLEVLRPFVCNKRRTINFYGELMNELLALASRRDAAGMQRTQQAFFTSRYGPKNFMGRMIVLNMVPAYSFIVKSYWTLEDDRSALLGRLAKS